MSNSLDKALGIVRAAGYRVTKSRTPRHKHKDHVGPTFVAEFADGAVTRLSVCTPLEKLDWGRGERLARHAWASRHKVSLDWNSAKLTETAPPIIACRFEQDGKVLAQRNGKGRTS